MKEAIIKDINGLVEDFWRTSSDRADGESFRAMRCLLEILQDYYDILKVCFYFISVYATAYNRAGETYAP